MPAPTMTRAQQDRLTSDLRMACMRISRRTRFESTTDLPPHQFSVLVRLDQGPRTPSEIAEIEQVSAPSVSRTVGSLVERGLVVRSENPRDGRQVVLTLTPAGRRTIKETRRRRDQWLALRLERLEDEELQVLVRAAAILEKVASE